MTEPSPNRAEGSTTAIADLRAAADDLDLLDETEHTPYLLGRATRLRALADIREREQAVLDAMTEVMEHHWTPSHPGQPTLSLMHVDTSTWGRWSDAVRALKEATAAIEETTE